MLTRVRVRLTSPSRKDSSERSSEYLGLYPPTVSERLSPLRGGNPMNVVEFCLLMMNSTKETDQSRPQLTAGGRREAEMATPTRLPALPGSDGSYKADSIKPPPPPPPPSITEKVWTLHSDPVPFQPFLDLKVNF